MFSLKKQNNINKYTKKPINFACLNIRNIYMKNLLKTFGGALIFFLFSTGEGIAQRNNNPLTHPSNYKTSPAGHPSPAKTEGNGILTEPTEAVSYKRPHIKSKTRRVSLETSAHPKRNYKWSRSR